MITKVICWHLLLFLPFTVSAQKKLNQLAARELRPVTFSLSEVMLHDVANPPVASRFYAYCLLAGYETMALYEPAYPSLHGRLNDFPRISLPISSDSVYYPFAALWAVLETGKGIMLSGYQLADKKAALEQEFRKKGLDENRINGSKSMARAVAAAVLACAKADGYAELTAMDRFRPSAIPGTWALTPPDRMAAIEPNWNKLRPFLLDSARQCRLADPVPFDTARGSRFFELLREVYDTDKNQPAEQADIANYWDCNPFAVYHSGHLGIGLKNISPAGHWINIAGQACEQQKLPFAEALRAQTWTALADAFIACWDEKYRCNRVRPVTAINRYLDPNWEPLLQTPPFPEYPSGHSTASAAAAVLTYLLGDNVAFTDATEVLYGMKP